MSLQQIIVLCKLYIAHYFFKSTLLGIVSVFTIHCWLLRFSTMNCWLAYTIQYIVSLL